MSSSHYKAMGGLRYVSGLVKVGERVPKKDWPYYRTMVTPPQSGGSTTWDRMHEKHPLATTAGYFTPFVSTALSLGDAANSFSKGKILGGIGNLGWAALGLIPGGGALRLLGKGRKAARALKLTRNLSKARHAANVARKTTSLGRGWSKAVYNAGRPFVRAGHGFAGTAGKLVPAGAQRLAARTGGAMTRAGNTRLAQNLSTSALPLNAYLGLSGYGAEDDYSQPMTPGVAYMGHRTFVGKPTRYVKRASSPTVGDLINSVSSDMSLDTMARNRALSQIRAETSGYANSTPLSSIASRVGGGVLGYMISKYFGSGLFGRAVGTLGGYAAGRYADRHFFNRDNQESRNGSPFRGYKGLA